MTISPLRLSAEKGSPNGNLRLIDIALVSTRVKSFPIDDRDDVPRADSCDTPPRIPISALRSNVDGRHK